MGGREARNEVDEMRPDKVTLQIISGSLLYASEEMGLALRNSAFSPNIKERMDHSAAVFDGSGRLLAQAEHIPVHLGSLPWGLKNLIDQCARDGIGLEEGTMVGANNPYITGTHLNDVTVAAPIHHRGELVAFVVNKAHHSDVGGVVPGSISINARTLHDEGFVLEPAVIWRNREFVAATVEGFASSSRTPTERRGDLKAQVAANVSGARRVRDLISKYGIEAFRLSGSYSFRHSESLSRKRLAAFRPGTYQAEDFLEGPEGEDLRISARVTIGSTGVGIDYSGTSSEVDYPLNAVFGVTLSGAYFVLRCLLGDDIPANHGAFAPVKVTAPEHTIVNPSYPRPVGGGNVETSQRNADVIFRALAPSARGKVPAAAGGSMNNVMIGGGRGAARWAFYETIGVGLGGGRGRDGVDGIQANMTNTMNTPIEEIERNLPIVMRKYELRENSCGAGEFRGGCGIVRAFQFTDEGTTVTVLADRGIHAPWGLKGGGEGERTRVTMRGQKGSMKLPVKCTLEHVKEGTTIEIATAGGGGYGSPRKRKIDKVEDDIENHIVSVGRVKKFAWRRRARG
jgi:N-methylhydantoinase B